MNIIYYSDELYHHGVQGQKWGVRRYQNEDGTLTDEGRQRYQKKKDTAHDIGQKLKKPAAISGATSLSATVISAMATAATVSGLLSGPAGVAIVGAGGVIGALGKTVFIPSAGALMVSKILEKSADHKLKKDENLRSK